MILSMHTAEIFGPTIRRTLVHSRKGRNVVKKMHGKRALIYTSTKGFSICEKHIRIRILDLFAATGPESEGQLLRCGNSYQKVTFEAQRYNSCESATTPFSRNLHSNVRSRIRRHTQ